MSARLALYTTVYPGVEPFLPDWYRSVRDQTDQDFQLWMGLDAVTVEALHDLLGTDPGAVCVPAQPGDSPAQVRQRALARIVDAHDAVVLVDADDVLYPTRVASARAALRRCDVAACAIRLVDRGGHDLGMTFALSSPNAPEAVLPRYNIFGLSNSSFRSNILRRCLPIPAEAALVDWYLATRAWLFGATFRADAEIGMSYRQYGTNTARVLPPFDGPQVARDTERVRRHFALVRSAADAPPATSTERLSEVERAAAEVDAFYRHVVARPAVLDRYLKDLNALAVAPYWWSSVAHPALRELWALPRSLS